MTYKLVFLAGNVGHLHVVGGGAEIFQLLLGEDIDGNQMHFGVTVLASLGSAHFDDLARALLDDDKAVLPERRALHREGGRGTGIGTLEGVLMLSSRWNQQSVFFIVSLVQYTKQFKLAATGMAG